MKQKPCNYFAYIYLYFRIIRKKKTSTQLKNKRKLNKKTFFLFHSNFTACNLDLCSECPSLSKQPTFCDVNTVFPPK